MLIQSNGLHSLYTFVGGVGIFYYGLKSISNTFQAFAGDLIKSLVNFSSTSSFLNAFVGILISFMIQSSYVTSIMVAGFVNAELMTLTQGLAIAWGGNLGSALVGWVLTLKIKSYALLFISLGFFPIILAQNSSWKRFGRMLFAIGMVFLGLNYMIEAGIGFLNHFRFTTFIVGNNFFLSYVLPFVLGASFAILTKTSLVAIGISAALLIAKVIGFKIAMVFLFGINLGIPFLALFSVKEVNIKAIRIMRGYLLFNVVGIIIAFLMLDSFIELIIYLSPLKGSGSWTITHLILGHTIFNLCMLILFIPFIKLIVSFLIQITPENKYKKQHSLVILGNPADMIPAMAIIEAEQEVVKLIDVVREQFDLTKLYINTFPNDARILVKIKDIEKVADQIKKEVETFISKLMERSLQTDQSITAQLILRIVGELESITDYLDKLATYKTGLGDEALFEEDSKEDLFSLLESTIDFYVLVSVGFKNRNEHDSTVDYRRSEQLKLIAETIRNNHIERVTMGKYAPLKAVIYSDIILVLKKIRGHCQNISQAIERELSIKRIC